MTANEEIVAIQNDESPTEIQQAVQTESTLEVLKSTDGIPDEVLLTKVMTQEELENSELDAFLETIPEDQHSPQDTLAAFYEKHLAAVKADMRLLGRNALERIMLNVLMGEFALQEYKPNLNNKTGRAEASVAHHFNEGVEKRMLLRFEMEFGKAQEAYEKEQADLAKIEEMNKLTPEAQAVLENMQGTTLGENNG